MSSSPSPPPPPDYGPIAAADQAQAAMANEIAHEQLDWAKQQYAEQKPLSDEVVHSLIDTQNQNNENAAKDRARYEQVYQPLEDQAVADAETYASPAKRDLEMGRAQAAVAQATDQQRQNSVRDLESFGVNPGATRFAALDVGTRVAQAGNEAAAGNQAGLNVDATARAMRDQAINVGRGYPAQVTAEYGTGNQSGTGAVNAGNSTIATGSNAMTQPAAYTGQATSALGQWGNTVNQGYQNQLAYYNAQNNSSSGLGAALGIGASLIKPFLFAADGGAIPMDDDVMAAASGDAGPSGGVPTGASPSRGRAIDDVPVNLTAGEFVMPKDVTSWYGEEKMHKMIEKARTGKKEAISRTGAAPKQHPSIGGHASAHPRRQAMPFR